MSWRHWFGLTAAVFSATALNGATTHLGSAILWIAVVAGLWGTFRSKSVPLDADVLILPGTAVLGVGLFWILSPSFGPGIPAAARVLLTVAVFLTLVSLREDHCPKVLWAAVAVGCAHSLWAITQVLVDARSTGGFFNPNMLAAFLCPCLACAVLWAHGSWPNPTPLTGRWLWLPVALLVGGLLATQSRSGAIAAMTAMAVIGWSILGSSRRGRYAMLAAVVLTVALGASQAHRWSGKGDRYRYARVELWSASAQVALDHPLGVGLGAYPAAMRQNGVPLDGMVRHPRAAHSAHNDLLHLWVEAGWLGLLIGLAAALWPLFQLRGRPRGEQLRGLGLWLTFAIPSFVYVTLRAPVMCLLAAAWAAAVTRARTSSAPQEDIVRVAGWRTPTFLAATAIAIATVPAAFAQVARDRAVHARDSGDLVAASAWADHATVAAPWTLSYELLAMSLQFQRGAMEPIEASERLADLGERFPDDPRPYERAARLATQHALKVNSSQGAWRLVAELRRRQADRDPTRTKVWVALGDALHRAGLTLESREALQTALQVEPNCADALARIAWSTTDTAEAKESARKAWLAHTASEKYDGYAKEVLKLSQASQTRLRSAGLGPEHQAPQSREDS